MKKITFHLFILLFNIPLILIYAQKREIKEAQKEFKAGNSLGVISILSPVDYLIGNSSYDDKTHFYYLKGMALVDLATKNINSDKNYSLAITAFNDLISTESESNKYKFSEEANASLKKIRVGILKSANEDLAVENFKEASGKFYQAYLIDKKDTSQLYNAAVSYYKGGERDLALNCFEELKAINYSGKTDVYIAYSKAKVKDEYFDSMKERDAQVQNGTHIRPRQEVRSKKADIYKSIALIYIQRGYKEKAIKAIELARSVDSQDLSLAVLEANLYLETKDYEYFDNLASVILKSNPNNAELAVNFGISCQNEKYYDGAERYFKIAVERDSRSVRGYLGLSALLVEKSVRITEQMNGLGTSVSDRQTVINLKNQKEQIIKRTYLYLQKVVGIDPFNSSVKQLMSCINITNLNEATTVLASGE